jgi:cytochrome o ubiquinol oxidase subunit 2
MKTGQPHPLIPLVVVLGIALAGVLAVLFFSDGALLNPKGLVAAQEYSLMRNAVLLMLIVVVPVFLLLFGFAWYYREDNRAAKYQPDWEHSRMDELVWWAIPLEIVLVLAALTYFSSHALDPRAPLVHAEEPLMVQAVALPSSWLFIYPEIGIASIGHLEIPAGRPITFLITADAPMNAFWIPELGGMIYAMTGMTTSLNLIADEPGQFVGRSSNYSGERFAHMRFMTVARPQEEFDAWVAQTKLYSPTALGWHEYETLREAEDPGVLTYAAVDAELLDAILMQFNAIPHTH